MAGGMKIKPLPAGFVVLSAAGNCGASATLPGQGFRVGMLADSVGDEFAYGASRDHESDKRKIMIARISDAGARRSGAQGASGDVEISIARRNCLAPPGLRGASLNA
jgi:hypothetical protein